MPFRNTHSASTELATDLGDRLISRVEAMRTSDGGWATSVGSSADVESTSWVLTGGVLLPSLAPMRSMALEWLLKQQLANGSWTYRPGPEIATWPTFPALLAITIAGGSTDARQRATSWVAKEHSAAPRWWQRVMARFVSPSASVTEPPVVLDASLDGYGWAHETFAWVEPTSIAMIALAAQPRSPALDERVSIGARLLLDRQSPDGGWNYGNKRVLGVDLPGYPDTTGWALLGLAAAMGRGRDAPLDVAAAAARGFALLARAPEVVSPLPVALTLLAQTAHGQRDAISRARGLALLQTALVTSLDGVRDGYPMLDTRTAVLALLALHDVDLFASVQHDD